MVMVIAHVGTADQLIIPTNVVFPTEEACLEDTQDLVHEIKEGHPDWEPLAFACRPIQQDEPT